MGYLTADYGRYRRIINRFEISKGRNQKIRTLIGNNGYEDLRINTELESSLVTIFIFFTYIHSIINTAR
jgi:hypothetical protein